MPSRPTIEVKLPKSFSPGAQVLADIIVEATQKNIKISEDLGQIIAFHLAVTPAELARIDQYIERQISTMLETFGHMLEDQGVL